LSSVALIISKACFSVNCCMLFIVKGGKKVVR